ADRCAAATRRTVVDAVVGPGLIEEEEEEGGDRFEERGLEERGPEEHRGEQLRDEQDRDDDGGYEGGYEGGRLMNLFLEAFEWIFSPDRATGALPLREAISTHLLYTVVSVVIAAAIAIPAGWLIGHT